MAATQNGHEAKVGQANAGRHRLVVDALAARDVVAEELLALALDAAGEGVRDWVGAGGLVLGSSLLDLDGL